MLRLFLWGYFLLRALYSGAALKGRKGSSGVVFLAFGKCQDLARSLPPHSCSRWSSMNCTDVRGSPSITPGMDLEWWQLQLLPPNCSEQPGATGWVEPLKAPVSVCR